MEQIQKNHRQEIDDAILPAIIGPQKIPMEKDQLYRININPKLTEQGFLQVKTHPSTSSMYKHRISYNHRHNGLNHTRSKPRNSSSTNETSITGG
jgi:hypothetical protein